MPHRIFVATIVALSVTATALAAETPPPPCSAPEYRQFDFWVGSWEVRDPAGEVVGHNRIQPILNGCVLLEEWTAAGGGGGKSFNVWDARRGVWHQTWVDGGGSLLQIEGGLDDSGAMVLRAASPSADGGEVRQRITWTPMADGRVRQHWESSKDAGSTWTTLFDGYYARVPAGE